MDKDGGRRIATTDGARLEAGRVEWVTEAEIQAILATDADAEFDRIIRQREAARRQTIHWRWTTWSGIAAACAVVAAVIVLWPVGERGSETEIAQTTVQTEDLDVVELENVSETEKLAGEKSDNVAETVAKPIEKQISTANYNRKLLALNNNKETTNETEEEPENTGEEAKNSDERLKKTYKGLENLEKGLENADEQSENHEATLADENPQSSTLDDVTPCNDIRCMAVIKTLRMLMALNNIPILEEDGEEVFNITQLALAMRPEEINRMTISAVYHSRSFTELRSNAAISGLVAKEIGTRDMQEFYSSLSLANQTKYAELNIGNTLIISNTEISFRFI